jgi:hypothetical protein
MDRETEREAIFEEVVRCAIFGIVWRGTMSRVRQRVRIRKLLLPQFPRLLPGLDLGREMGMARSKMNLIRKHFWLVGLLYFVRKMMMLWKSWSLKKMWKLSWLRC